MASSDEDEEGRERHRMTEAESKTEWGIQSSKPDQKVQGEDLKLVLRNDWDGFVTRGRIDDPVVDVTHDQDPRSQIEPYQDPKLICKYCKAEHEPLTSYCEDCGRPLDFDMKSTDMPMDVRERESIALAEEAVRFLVPIWWNFKKAYCGSYT